jgi:transposase
LDSAKAHPQSLGARRTCDPALGEKGLATGKKNAARRAAAIVFIDEAGFLMAPLVRRTWAPRGCTPILLQRGRSRRKVSVIGALVVSPQRRRVRAYFEFLPDANFDGDSIRAFLVKLCRTLRAPIALIWDRLGAHIGEPVAAWLVRNRHRMRAHLLPPYAPELNPVELIWGHTKSNPLANFAPSELDELLDQTQVATLAIGDDEPLLRSFIKHCDLSLRLK